MNVLPAHIYVHYMQTWCTMSEEVIGSPGIGIMGGCEPPCWETNPGPLQEEQTLLATEPSFSPAPQIPLLTMNTAASTRQPAQNTY